jgi:hypothetical protein
VVYNFLSKDELPSSFLEINFKNMFQIEFFFFMLRLLLIDGFINDEISNEGDVTG